MSSRTGTPSVAVVVATRDRGRKIAPLIESVLASDLVDFELVIVDQSAGPETEAAVGSYLGDDRVRYVHSDVPGVSRGRNRGVALTTAPVIAITDDDCTVPANWLRAIAQPFVDHPRVGVVFCSVEAVPVSEPGLTPAITFPCDRIVDDVVTAWRLSCDGLSLGAGMAVRRTAFDAVSGFDELLGPGARFGACEDNDLSWRALIAGWWTFQHSGVAVTHDGFRNLDELRDLVKRDFFGVGGTVAKYLRTRELRISRFVLTWILRYGVIDPAREVLGGRRPTGFRRPYMLLRGLVEGLRTPLDRRRRVYRGSSYPQ